MRKNYIQPQTEAQMMQNLHVICSSPEAEITSNMEGADPNTMPVY